MNILYIIAMQAEAQPFIDNFQVEEEEGYFAPLPCKLYRKEISDHFTLHVVLLGQQHGTDLVGCEAASVATTVAIQRIQPDLVINSGTCGGWESKGAEIGKVYIADGVMFHDRRVPGDDKWGTQALGNYPVWEGCNSIASKLNLPMGKVTTGSSLDLLAIDQEIIDRNNGSLKDMEGAAVAFVCSLYNVPIMFVKSVTDLCDDTADTYETFIKNLKKASDNLNIVNQRIIELLAEENLI